MFIQYVLLMRYYCHNVTSKTVITCSVCRDKINKRNTRLADVASQGIKVTDADSKKKAIKLLKAEQAMKQMDIDSEASDSGSDVEMK